MILTAECLNSFKNRVDLHFYEYKCIFDHDHPPHKEMKKPHINLNIRGTHTSKKDTDPVDLLFSAQETIEQYPENWIHIYTDGSAFKGTVNAGYGSRIQYPDQTSEELFDSCGAQRSNFEAEAEAIDASLQNISKHFRDKTKIPNSIFFSDAKSVLQSLKVENWTTQV